MFRLIGLVSAVYLFHNHSKKFIGFGKKDNSKDELMLPVANREGANDLKFLEGGIDSKKARTTLNSVSKRKVRILHSDKDFSLAASKKKLIKDRKMILQKSSSSKSQQFTVIMLANFQFALRVKNKCVIYDANKQYFKLGSCKNLTNSTFTIYQETTPSQARRASPAISCPTVKDPVIIQASKNQDPDVIKLSIKGNKLIREGQKPIGEHIKIGHQLVDVKVKEVPYKDKDDAHVDLSTPGMNKKLKRLGFNHI